MTRKMLNWILFGGGALIVIVVAALTLPKLIADEMFPVPEDVVAMIEGCKQKLELTDVDTALVLSILKQESGFNPNAVSYAGAKGMGQIMPATWQSILNSEPRIAEISTDPFNAEANICGTVFYTAGMLGRYADRSDKVEMALAAYNAGPGGAEPGSRPAQTVNYVAVVAGVNYPAYQKRLAELSSSSETDFVEDKENLSYLEEILGSVVGSYKADKSLVDTTGVEQAAGPTVQIIEFFSRPFYVST